MQRINSWVTPQIHFQFLVTLMVIIAAVFGLLAGYTAMSHPPPPIPDLIISSHSGLMSPEPAERFVFISCSILALLVSFLLVFIPRHMFCADNMPRTEKYSGVLSIFIAVLLFSPFVGSEFIATIIGRFGETRPQTLPVTIVSGAVASAWCCFFVRMPVRSKSTWLRCGLPLSWVIFIGALSLQLFSWRLVSIHSITRSPIWFDSADPVFFTISQVVAGKTILADLPSQYGLFPEIVAPLFQFAGLSVLGVCSCFALMQIFSMSALFFLLSRVLKGRVVLVITGLALVALTFETVLHYIHNDDCYFQYWPIRFFWPALSVVLFYGFSKKMTLFRSALMSVVAGISLLWNIDSGIFVVIAYGAFLAVRAVVAVMLSLGVKRNTGPVEWPVTAYLQALLLHSVIVAAVVAIFLGLLSLKSHGDLDISLLFKYQKIFYGIGFMMLPLPRLPDPWMAVLCVYILGALTALTVWRLQRGGTRHDLMFFLSMLGTGLFIYYQGRSHVLNLVSVCWPAVILVAMLMDELLRLIRARIQPRIQLTLPAAGLTLLLIAGMGFLNHAPRFFNESVREQFGQSADKDALVADELEFIQRSAGTQQRCLILSKRQGIYYTETGLVSPLKGPGLAESILSADRKELTDSVVSGRIPCLFLGIGPDSNAGADIPYNEILSRYTIAGMNSMKTMLYLKPNP